MQEKDDRGVLSTPKKPGGTGAGDAALIADLQLGQIEEVYTLDRSLRSLIIFWIVVALLVLSFGMWAFTAQFGFHASVYFPTIVLIPLLIIFLSRYRYGGVRLYICTDGLLYLWRKRRESRRWEEVGVVHQNTRSRLEITSKDGREFSFDQPDRVSQLLMTLQAKGAHFGFRVTSYIRLPHPPETGSTCTPAIAWLKPVYSGRESSISGPVTLTILHQGQDGDLTAKWSRDDLGTEFSCEGTITREGILTLASTDTSRDSVLQIHGSILPNGHLEGSLDVVGKDGSSQKHDWSLNASTPNMRNRPCKTSLKPDARPQEAEAHSAITHWKHIA